MAVSDRVFCGKDKCMKYLFQKGHLAFGGFETRFKKGHKHSKEAKEKMRLAKLGKKQSQEAIKKRVESRRGYKHSDETIAKISGEKNCNWKGDDVGYGALHIWIRRNLGEPTKCENCGKEGLSGYKIHWANIDHKYRRVEENWMRLCVKCHRKYDKINNPISKKNGTNKDSKII